MNRERVESIRWDGERLELLDQRILPSTETWLAIESADDAIGAIRDLVVRGAPAIGITAAYACVLAARRRGADTAGWHADLDRLVAARPTAINLRWAVERMRAALHESEPGASADALRVLAERIHADDLAANRAMAVAGATMIDPGSVVVTHCNTGSLATGGTGTALGVLVEAWRQDRLEQVYACETRPWLQGLRLTAWELAREGVPVDVLVEGAVAGLMRRRKVDWVVTGADRITANGDVVNKIGTLMLAILARRFGARMMVVAPVSTLDPASPDGSCIEIEQRDGGEIWRAGGLDSAPAGVGTYNPVFDVTPNELIDVIVTEGGVVSAPFGDRLAGLAVSA